MEMAEEAQGASDGSSLTRIFIGGLGAAVTAHDLENIFSSLGTVSNVEFVRTNWRNFAYMDFEPNSDKSLTKLFSTYNGCKFKGGKLRLERAKENYLDRLKREWAGDAVLSAPAARGTEQTRDDFESETLNLESMKLKMFFPKLKKVKLLPYKGTGKHKYSFQRVEVPALPLHFCDCEEHCGPPESADQNYCSALDSAALDKEMSIMNTVMNRLFKSEQEEQDEKITELPIDFDPNTTDESVDNETQLNEEDLVINISTRNSDQSSIQFKKRETLVLNQERRLREIISPKKNTTEKQTDSPVTESKGDGDEFSALLFRNSGSAPSRDINTASFKSNDETDMHGTKETTRSTHNSWFQKSAWRDLVGESANSLFSLSSSNPIQTQSNRANTERSTAVPSKKRDDRANNETHAKKRKQEEKPTTVVGAESSSNSNSNRNNNIELGRDRRTIPKVTIGEVCPFMRSADSGKEWTKAKKALGGFIKKKNNENNGNSSVSKGNAFHR